MGGESAVASGEFAHGAVESVDAEGIKREAFWTDADRMEDVSMGKGT